MRQVSFDKLMEKEVINFKDCKRLGFINDLCIDIECGRVLSFTVKDCTGFLPGKGNEITVPWECVTKIGDDIIFVDICHTAPSPPPKRRFLG